MRQRKRGAASGRSQSMPRARDAQCAGYYGESWCWSCLEQAGKPEPHPRLAQLGTGGRVRKTVSDLIQVGLPRSRRAVNCCQWILSINQSADHSHGARRPGRESPRERRYWHRRCLQKAHIRTNTKSFNCNAVHGNFLNIMTTGILRISAIARCCKSSS